MPSEGARYELPDLGAIELVERLPGTLFAPAKRNADWNDPGPLEVLVVDLETARPVGGLVWQALHAALPATTGLPVTLVGDNTTGMIVSLATPDGGRVLRLAAHGTVRASADAVWWDLDPAPAAGRWVLAVVGPSGVTPLARGGQVSPLLSPGDG